MRAVLRGGGIVEVSSFSSQRTNCVLQSLVISGAEHLYNAKATNKEGHIWVKSLDVAQYHLNGARSLLGRLFVCLSVCLCVAAAREHALINLRAAPAISKTHKHEESTTSRLCLPPAGNRFVNFAEEDKYYAVYTNSLYNRPTSFVLYNCCKLRINSVLDWFLEI